MSDLIYTTAQPFKIKGRKTLKTTEFIFTLVLDLKWFKPAEAKALLQTAVNNGLITQEGENVTANFDPTQVNPPLDFKPTTDLLAPFEESLFERILERIILATGEDKRRIIAAINQNQERLFKLVDINVSALIIAVEKNVEVSDLIDAACEEIATQQ
jgi:hypothetical protein